MPIRWRLTLWFSLILCGILVLSGIILHFNLKNSLIRSVDDNLTAFSARVHGTLHSGDITGPLDFSTVHANLPEINELAYPGIYLQIVRQDGTVAAKSDNLGQQELPFDQALVDEGFDGIADVATVSTDDGTEVRIMESPLYLVDQTLVLEIGQSLAPVQRTLDLVKYALLGSILSALLLASISGSILLRRALASVSRITRTAATIASSKDLTKRVEYRGPADEIGRLATTFDHMIAQIDAAFASQKRFVADASHDLRSPLTVIRGNLDLLKRNLSEADRAECLRSMRAETERMSGIVNDLLLLAEIELGQSEAVEEVSLGDILREEHERALKLGKNRAITISRQEDLSIRANPQRLKQALGNLLDNAIRFTPENGAISLSLAREDEYARLDVSDNGIGISADDLPRIFDRFYRVDKARSRSEGHAGLGLAIVKGIAERYGGRVAAVSEPGKGSTFTVWLRL